MYNSLRKQALGDDGNALYFSGINLMAICKLKCSLHELIDLCYGLRW